MKTIILYAHAVQDPFDQSIAKPFEFREVAATIKPPVFDAYYGEYTGFVQVGDREFRESGRTADEATKAAIFEVEFHLMYESQEPWRKPKAQRNIWDA